jgi:hypothetical protein
MICGEFGLPTDSDSGFLLIMGVYTVMYFFMAFSLLLNFFLAIVIDSYAAVQDKVKECTIESTIGWDIMGARTRKSDQGVSNHRATVS